MFDPPSRTPERDLESSSSALQVLLNKRRVEGLCYEFSTYCLEYYRSLDTQIPEEVEPFVSDLIMVAKTAHLAEDISGHILGSDTGMCITPDSNSAQS